VGDAAVNYFLFEARIKRLAFAASEKARFRFAQDTLLLLHRAAAETIARAFTLERQQLVAEILANVNVESTADLKAKLDQLGVLGFCPYVTDLLSAIGNWLDYRATRNPEFILRVAVDMVNMLDDHIGGDSGKYSTDNMLGAKAMREEYHRQGHFLAGQ
jgi:hypothetical protein